MALRALPGALGVVALATTACGPARSQQDAGPDAATDDAGVADAGSDAGSDGGMPLCPSGCSILIVDGGPVFYADGGPHCLC